MGALRTIVSNGASNAAGYIVALVLAILVTPLALQSLGDDLYGVWLVIVSVTGYYGILDLGIRGAVAQFVARHWSTNDLPGLSRTVSTALAVTAGIAIVLIGCTILLATAGEGLFGVPSERRDDLRQAVLIFGIGVALSFPMAVFGSAIQARNRFDLVNLIGIGERLCTNGLYVLVLHQGHGIVALAWVTTCTAMVAHFVRACVALRLLPGVELSFRHITRPSARELFGFGLFSFLVSICDRLVLYTDVLTVQLVLGVAAVTYYSLGSSFIHHYMGLVNSVAWTLTPHATALDAQRDMDSLRTTWLVGSRMILQLATIIGAGLVFLGGDFLSVWVGARYVSGELFVSAATIMAVLAVAALLRCSTTCGKQVLYGMRDVRFLARLALGEALANVVLSIALAFWLGNLGVALGNLLPAIVVHLWLQPRHTARRLGTTSSHFFLSVIPPALAVFGVMGLMRWAMGTMATVTSWSSLALFVAVVGTAGVVASWCFGLGRAERTLAILKLGLSWRKRPS